MKAQIQRIEHDDRFVIVHIDAPAEWWDLLRRGHNLPLRVPQIRIRKAEFVEVVIGPERVDRKTPTD